MWAALRLFAEATEGDDAEKGPCWIWLVKATPRREHRGERAEERKTWETGEGGRRVRPGDGRGARGDRKRDMTMTGLLYSLLTTRYSLRLGGFTTETRRHGGGRTGREARGDWR